MADLGSGVERGPLAERCKSVAVSHRSNTFLRQPVPKLHKVVRNIRSMDVMVVISVESGLITFTSAMRKTSLQRADNCGVNSHNSVGCSSQTQSAFFMRSDCVRNLEIFDAPVFIFVHLGQVNVSTIDDLESPLLTTKNNSSS